MLIIAIMTYAVKSKLISAMAKRNKFFVFIIYGFVKQCYRAIVSD